MTNKMTHNEWRRKARKHFNEQYELEHAKEQESNKKAPTSFNWIGYGVITIVFAIIMFVSLNYMLSEENWNAGQYNYQALKK